MPSSNAQTSQDLLKPASDVTSETMEAKPSGRSALPEVIYLFIYNVCFTRFICLKWVDFYHVFHILQRAVFYLQDLFTATYPSYAVAPGWQTRPPGFGFNMQYNAATVPIALQHAFVDFSVLALYS